MTKKKIVEYIRDLLRCAEPKGNLYEELKVLEQQIRKDGD